MHEPVSLPRQEADRPEIAPASVLWRRQRVFPGHERELSRVRRWLAALLPACPNATQRRNTLAAMRLSTPQAGSPAYCPGVSCAGGSRRLSATVSGVTTRRRHPPDGPCSGRNRLLPRQSRRPSPCRPPDALADSRSGLPAPRRLAAPDPRDGAAGSSPSKMVISRGCGSADSLCSLTISHSASLTSRSHDTSPTSGPLPVASHSNLSLCAWEESAQGPVSGLAQPAHWAP